MSAPQCSSRIVAASVSRVKRFLSEHVGLAGHGFRSNRSIAGHSGYLGRQTCIAFLLLVWLHCRSWSESPCFCSQLARQEQIDLVMANTRLRNSSGLRLNYRLPTATPIGRATI